MSEQRRQRQNERDPQPAQGAKYLKWVGIAALFVAAYIAGWYHKNHKYDGFAKCIASKQAKMYGLYTCPHCADQKAMFGASFAYVPYVECLDRRSTDNLAPACAAAGVKLFPSWQIGADPPKPGILSLEKLSEKTGCSLP